MSKSRVITKEEVKKVAHLSRLALSTTEFSKATKDLSGILDHFSSIQAIDTAGVATADDVSGLQNVTRKDVVEQGSLCQVDELLKRAPRVKDGQVQVEAVFDKRN